MQRDEVVQSLNLIVRKCRKYDTVALESLLPIADAALALLKPVPVQVLFVTPYKSSGIKHARCPGCDSFINSISNAVCCGRCGQAVKWDA